MEGIEQVYLVIGAGIGLVVCLVLAFLGWCLGAISAISDDREGVRDE
jgi:hypothetical protein